MRTGRAIVWGGLALGAGAALCSLDSVTISVVATVAVGAAVIASAAATAFNGPSPRLHAGPKLRPYQRYRPARSVVR